LEIVTFTAVAIVLYLLSDRALDFIEQQRGRRLKYRGVLFFVILLILALVSFRIIEQISGGA